MLIWPRENPNLFRKTEVFVWANTIYDAFALNRQAIFRIASNM